MLRGLVGHPGEDYGSNAETNGYNFAYDFAFSVTQGSMYGMYCYQGDEFWDNESVGRAFACEALDVSL